MKFFNARVWLIVFGVMGLLGGAGNAIGAESVALSEWGDLDGQALDIAIGLEVAWGAILSVWAASVIVITLSLQRARGRARFGAVTVVAVFLSQIVAVGALSNLGYGEGGSPPLPAIVALIVGIITLISCIRDWNATTASTPEPAA
ncbi:MAG: hypothetical protein L7U55_07370 [Candidatus Nanopelagicales bacterium]|nr:hypothetical protein [Candidatus Nanopelagicales bacterium]